MERRGLYRNRVISQPVAVARFPLMAIYCYENSFIAIRIRQY